MPGIARDGDTTSHGGTLIPVTTKTYVNGKLVITVTALHSCPEHGMTTVVTGSPNVFKEGMAVARIGDLCSCGATIVTGSPDTFAN